MKNKTPKKKIIIVGAGIAGLAACKHLMGHGYDVTILEARDRCGGRIWIDNSLGIPLGRGAAWIHGDEGNPIAQLAKNSNAKMVVVDPKKFITFNQKGVTIPFDVVQKFGVKFQMLLDQAKELAFSSEQDISLSAALSHFIKSDDFSPIEKELLEAKLLVLESYIGANSELLSARYWDQEEAWPGNNSFLTSSYQPIVDHLVEKCPILLNTIVTKITIRANDVELMTENKDFYADAVIITVPLGVLKKGDILFNPPLPDDKQQAIQRLAMGLYNITAIKFPKSFWPKQHQALFFTTFDDSSISIFFNLNHFIPQAILFGVSAGNRARQLENFTDAQLIEKTMQNFKKVFGSGLPEPEAYFNTRWSHDPFSYGSYSYIPTGASGDDYEVIATSVVDRIFFAGEATSSKYPATTHGAYLSGIREAEKIMNCYK